MRVWLVITNYKCILQVELANHEPRIKAVTSKGEDMIASNHYGSGDIQTTLNELDDLWNQIMVSHTQ